jgi:ABC-type transport system substrate-binding protein
MVVALGALSLFALGGGFDSAPGKTVRSGGTLRVAAAGDVDSLDPALAIGPLAWGIEYGTCATLTAFGDAPAPAGNAVRPEAASRLPEISRDGRTYVFTIRRGLRFNDGSPLTARNFSWALSRVLNPAMRSAGAAFFSDVKRVSARGRRLRIELSKPGGDLLTRLALPLACPVPLGFPVDPAGVPLLGVGSGPYYVARHVPNSLLEVERNRYYRGPRPHRIDRLVMTVDSNIGNDARAVEEGRADFLAVDLPFALRDDLVRRYRIDKSQLFRIRGTVVYYLALNTSRPLFRGNVALRKAVNLALNRTEIVKAGPGWPISWTPTDQIAPRMVSGWVDHRIYPLNGANLKRARRLASGNLRGGKAVLYASQLPFLVDQANVIARQLGQIGLAVTVTPLAPPILDTKAGTPGAPYDMLLTRHEVRYPDPADVMIHLLAGENARRPAGNTNFAYFDKPGYNRKMAAAHRLTGSARLQAFSKLDAEIMRTEAPWAPVFEGSRWVFVSKRVGCLKSHPVFRLDYAAICLR